MNKAIWLLLVIGCLIYAGSRFIQHDSNYKLSTTLRSGPAPSLIQKIMAGPFTGIAADYNILGAFFLYDQIKTQLPDSKKVQGWKQLAAHLDRTSEIDPWFMDTYRLASGLLAYSDYDTSRTAVSILEKGIKARTWDWELPFLAGFISYDKLADNKLAFDYMKIATERPGVPPLAIGLASRILNREKGVDASIFFLQYLLKTMPEAYHGQIQRRIHKLKQTEPHFNGETAL